MSQTTDNISRRSALKLAAAATTPLFIPGRLLGNNSPSNTLRIASIGVGRMGRGDMQECLNRGLDPAINARIVAVCDVDTNRAESARRLVEMSYAEDPRAGKPEPVKAYGDYRRLLERADIDGVTISTPDHWHALAAISAAKAGKDIYLQKPLTYTIGEGQQLVKAVRDNQRILQTGSQQRSSVYFRRVCQLVRNGGLGKLREIHVGIPRDRGRSEFAPMSIPTNLNYEMWMGPTAKAPYAVGRVHPMNGFGRPGWLQIERYCRGMITGWGAHMFDIAQWGHGGDHDSGPITISATGEFPDRGLFDVHTDFKAEGEYGDGVKLFASSSTGGVKFVGDDGWAYCTRGRFDASSPDLLRDHPSEKFQLTVSDNHMVNFLSAMRTRKDPICPVEVGHRSNSVCLLIHTAMKVGRNLNWDPQAERFLDDDDANATLDYAHREPWTV